MTGPVQASTQTAISTRFVEPAPVEALVALFDDGLGPVVRGDALPPLWHWAALPGWSPATLSGPDGHPRTGGFLPDLNLSRRMFAGGLVELHRPLPLGSQVRLEERVVSIEPKSGRQGDFVLVGVESTVYDEDGVPALIEHRDLVYRDAVASPAPSGPTVALPPGVPVGSLLTQDGDGWLFRTDPQLLMRFSSATSNGHRIHYDEPYATQVEGYPGLVVHGPLMALAMVEVLRLEGVDDVRSIAHRSVRPLFCGQEARIRVIAAGDGAREVSLSRGDVVHAVLTARTALSDRPWAQQGP